MALPAALLAASWLGMTPAQADPLEDAARSPVEVTALAVAPRESQALALSPEVSATRTLAPPGASATGLDGRPMNELAGVQLRLWMSRGRTAWGVGVGTLGYVPAAQPLHAPGAVSLAAATPAVSVGMRYRITSDSAVFADAYGARALPPESMGYLSTKVGMEWKPATSRFGLDHGALGVQFNSGYRLSFKARKDGLRIYLRGQF